MDPLIWHPGNDNFVLVDDARNAITGSPLIGAAGEARIETDPGGVLVSGITNPIPAVEVPSRPGSYVFVADKAANIAAGQALRAKWNLEGAGGESASGIREISVVDRNA